MSGPASGTASAVPGIVPAAGLSTRMGSSKPLLDAGGLAFVERVVKALAGGGCDPVIVVVRNPDGPEARMARKAGAVVIVNPDPSDGPISSLRAALRALEGSAGGPPDVENGGSPDVETGGTADGREQPGQVAKATDTAEMDGRLAGCAFCPVDHPRIDADTVSFLYDAFIESDAPIVVPVYDSRRGHPVFFRSSLFPELLERDLPEGARTVVHRHAEEVSEVRVEDAGVLVDIDTRDEYQRHYPAGFEESFEDQ